MERRGGEGRTPVSMSGRSIARRGPRISANLRVEELGESEKLYCLTIFERMEIPLLLNLKFSKKGISKLVGRVNYNYFYVLTIGQGHFFFFS